MSNICCCPIFRALSLFELRKYGLCCCGSSAHASYDSERTCARSTWNWRGVIGEVPCTNLFRPSQLPREHFFNDCWMNSVINTRSWWERTPRYSMPIGLRCGRRSNLRLNDSFRPRRNDRFSRGNHTSGNAVPRETSRSAGRSTPVPGLAGLGAADRDSLPAVSQT